jgi:hypothetical protein
MRSAWGGVRRNTHGASGASGGAQCRTPAWPCRYNPNAVPEPNNLFPPEYCAAANYSQAVAGLFSWSDTNCGNSYIFMCWVKGEWQLVPACGLGAHC